MGIATALRWIAAGLFALAVFPVVQEFFIELAREQGAYDRPTERVGRFMSGLAGDPLYLLFVAFLGGLLVGSVMDWLFRKVDRRRSADVEPQGTATLATTSLPKEEAHPMKEPASEDALPSIEYHPGFNHRREGEDGKQWITVRLMFRTDRTVNNARPYLLCARRYENGAWSANILAGMRVLLSWPGSGNRFEPRTIYTEEPALLFDYDVEERRLSFVNDKKHTPHSLKKFMNDIHPGKYIIQVGVGDDMEMSEGTFILDWFGDFESLSLERASLAVVEAQHMTPYRAQALHEEHG